MSKERKVEGEVSRVATAVPRQVRHRPVTLFHILLVMIKARLAYDSFEQF
jgi:hypothetical protein